MNPVHGRTAANTAKLPDLLGPSACGRWYARMHPQITHQREKQMKNFICFSQSFVGSDRHVLHGRQGGCGRTKLGEQAVFSQSITFTLSGSTAVDLCRGWLGDTLGLAVMFVSAIRD